MITFENKSASGCRSCEKLCNESWGCGRVNTEHDLTRHSKSLAGLEMMMRSFFTNSVTKMTSELSERSNAWHADRQAERQTYISVFNIHQKWHLMSLRAHGTERICQSQPRQRHKRTRSKSCARWQILIPKKLCRSNQSWSRFITAI